MVQTGTGMCFCAAVAGAAPGKRIGNPETENDTTDWIREMEERMKEGSRTPDWNKAEFAQEWVKRLMTNMDQLLDEEERKTLMQACGRSCFINAFGVASKEPPDAECLDNFLKGYQDRGETEIRREGNTVYFQYGINEQNRYGLRLLHVPPGRIRSGKPFSDLLPVLHRICQGTLRPADREIRQGGTA